MEEKKEEKKRIQKIPKFNNIYKISTDRNEKQKQLWKHRETEGEEGKQEAQRKARGGQAGGPLKSDPKCQVEKKHLIKKLQPKE